MTVKELAEKLELKVISGGAGLNRTPNSIYCCDLLSIVMGRAPKDSAWITVMANSNTVAVAVLADVACVILSEGVTFNEDTIKKAEEEDVCVLATELPTFEIARKIDGLLKL